MVAVAAARDAAHVDRRHARLRALERDRGKELRIIREAGDVELVELARAERLEC